MQSSVTSKRRRRLSAKRESSDGTGEPPLVQTVLGVLGRLAALGRDKTGYVSSDDYNWLFQRAVRIAKHCGCRRMHDAEDVASVAVVKAVKNSDFLLEKAAADSWFYVIVRHEAIRHFRTESKQLTATAELLDDFAKPTPASSLFDYEAALKAFKQFVEDANRRTRFIALLLFKAFRKNGKWSLKPLAVAIKNELKVSVRQAYNLLNTTIHSILAALRAAGAAGLFIALATRFDEISASATIISVTFTDDGNFTVSFNDNQEISDSCTFECYEVQINIPASYSSGGNELFVADVDIVDWLPEVVLSTITSGIDYGESHSVKRDGLWCPPNSGGSSDLKMVDWFAESSCALAV